MSSPFVTNLLALPNGAGANGYVRSLSADPTAGAGIAASIGTIGVVTGTGEVYSKRIAADWGWWRADGKPPWDWDIRSFVGCPSDATQWDRVISACGLTGTVATPDALYLCQEGSGNLADSIGSFTLTAAGTGLSYGSNTAGWDRRGVQTSDNLGGAWANTAAGLPDLSTGDLTFCSFALRVSSTAARSVIVAGTTTVAYVGGAGVLRGASGANAQVGTTNDSNVVVVRPYGFLSQRSSGTLARAWSDDTLLSFSIGAVTGKQIAIGAVGGVVNPSTNVVFYAWAWFSAVSMTNVKAIHNMLNWNVTWTPA